jgi:hypothetical protein
MADYVPPGYRGSTYRRSIGPRQSTRAVTAKLLVFAVVATLAIGLLIASQMASGNDPALGPKAVAQAKKSAAKSRSGSSSAATGSGSGADPYGQVYGDDGYYYGSGSSGYSGGYGSSGYSSGSGGSTNSAPPVTSSTS